MKHAAFISRSYFLNFLNNHKVKALLFSCVQLFATPWTVARQALLSVKFSRPEYWSGLPFPSPGDLLDPGIKPGSPALQADSLLSEPPGKPLQKRLLAPSARSAVDSCILWIVKEHLGFPSGTSGKEPTCQSRRCKRLRFDPWVGKIP